MEITSLLDQLAPTSSRFECEVTMRKSGGRPLYSKRLDRVGMSRRVGTKQLLAWNGRISLARATFPLCEHGCGHGLTRYRSRSSKVKQSADYQPWSSDIASINQFRFASIIEGGWTSVQLLFLFVCFQIFLVQFRNTTIFGGFEGGGKTKIKLFLKFDLYLQNIRQYRFSFAFHLFNSLKREGIEFHISIFHLIFLSNNREDSNSESYDQINVSFYFE